MSDDVTLTDVTASLSTEALPDVSDMAEEHAGAWPKGHYKATVLEGYGTRSGKTFQTEDRPSKNGDSRNLVLCVKVVNKAGEERTIQANINYRPSDFTPERIAYIKEMRQEFKGVRGKWSDADAQRSSLALAKIGELQKTFGPISRNPDGSLIAGALVGKEFDAYLRIDDNGYNELVGFAPLKK